MRRLACLIAFTGLACQEQGPAKTGAHSEANSGAKKETSALKAAPKVEVKAAAAPKTDPKVTAKVAAKRTPAKALTTGHGKGSSIKWEGPVQWSEWDAAQALAKKENKPICLVGYADWCPRCRELAPAFKDAEVVALAEKMVMVRQNSDAKPAWLETLATFGSYVPRIFFFGPDGSLREEITSSHPRYPYFYTPKGIETLKKSMKAAVEG